MIFFRENVKPIPSVQITKPVLIFNVLIHVLDNVELVQHVKVNVTLLFVHALDDQLVMLLYHAENYVAIQYLVIIKFIYFFCFSNDAKKNLL